MPVISDRFVGAVWNKHPAAKGQLSTEVLGAYPYLLEPDMPITPLHESMYWHARRDRDPGHAWLREQIRAVSHA
jgi:DNA-binding transcriptional LysR family regulator